MKRIAFYLFQDEAGIVDRFVPHCLQQLREHAQHIVVLTTGAVTPEGREALAEVSDEVWPVGHSDRWAYAEGVCRLGTDRLSSFDEAVFLDDSFFGPIFPFAEAFDRADGLEVDFWGITHEATGPSARGTAVRIQPYWCVVRGRMLKSEEFRAYCAEGPAGSDLTEHFGRLGFTWDVLFGEADLPSLAPGLSDAVALAAARCPALPLETFSHDPNEHSSYAVIGRDVVDIIGKTSDYPLELVWEHVARTVEPRVAATNFSLMRVFSDAPETVGDELERVRSLRAAVIVHCFYEDMLDGILDQVAVLPCDRHVVVTTDSEEKRDSLERRIAERGEASFEVRTVGSNIGRDISAFLITCADVLRDEGYDLVVKLHSKRSPQDSAPAADWFRRHLFDNLLHSSNYSASVLSLFVAHPELGMVIPPAIHIGYRSLGNAWFRNKRPAERLAERLGISVPFDYSTPLAAYGSMFIARPRALRTLVDAGFDWSDFEGDYADGSLAHVLERLFTYSSLNEGMPVYSVMNTELASINYMFLEYKVQSFSEYLPGNAAEQKALLDARAAALNLGGWSKSLLTRKTPKLAEALKDAYQRASDRVRGVERGPGYRGPSAEG